VRCVIPVYAVNLVICGLAALTSVQAAQADVSPGPAIQCTPDLCWYLNADGLLQGVRRIREASLRSTLETRPEALSLLPQVPFSQLQNAQARFQQIRETLRRRWSVAAHSVVSNIFHTNAAILNETSFRLATEWNGMVGRRVSQEIMERNNIRATIVMTIGGAVSFRMPDPTFGLIQNFVFQIMLRAVLPQFLLSDQFPISQLPRELAHALADAEIGALAQASQNATAHLLDQVALQYLVRANGEAELQAAGEDQAVQMQVLTTAAGTPALPSRVFNTLKASRDFRLMYAAKLATALGPMFSTHLNSFIVTGEFAEMAWADTGVPTTGVLFDLYRAEPAPFPHSASPFVLRGENIRKREWFVSPAHELQWRDRGAFMEARGLRRYIELPYWDRAILPQGEEGPVLRADLRQVLNQLN
jgi:hypothetical protein